VQIEWVKGEGGRTIMKEIPGSEKVWPADLVLLAMGFLGPEKEGMLADLGVKLDERTNVVADANKQTNIPGIFVAGDMTRGQSLIVWAIQEGRAAARGVDMYLMGETLLP
jgi:glutamate synthase (NADPH/NADH) small chain